jgi:hypothetical protein
MGLSDSFFAGDESAGTVETPEAPAAEGKDVKPAAGDKPGTATPASSAGQAPSTEARDTPDAGKPEQPRDEQGRFTKDGREDPEGEYVPRAAMHGERTRRQAAETQAAELARQLAALQQGRPAQAPRQEEPELTDEQVLENPAKSIKAVGTQAEQRVLNRFFNMSDHQARQRHQDWGALTDELVAECASDPKLRQEAMGLYEQAADPGEAIYEFAKEVKLRKAVKAAGGFDAYLQSQSSGDKARIAELEAEITALKSRGTNLSEVPESLNSTPAATRPSGRADEPHAEKSLTEILEPRRKRA